MAVVLVRVDQRLLHGQVVEGWVPFLKADAVVVADDRAAADPISKIAMTSACPAKVRLEVLPVRAAAVAANEGTLPGARTLLLVSSVDALWQWWEAGARVQAVNVGNVPIAPGRSRVTSSVALSADEVKRLDSIAADGTVVEAKAVPREKAAGLDEIHRAMGVAGGSAPS